MRLYECVCEELTPEFIAEFIDMLNEMRFGTLTPASIAKFKELKRDPCYTDGIDPTELYVAAASCRPSR